MMVVRENFRNAEFAAEINRNPIPKFKRLAVREFFLRLKAKPAN